MAKKKRQLKRKPEGGIIRMGPIVWSEQRPAPSRPIGGVVIMGPISPEGGGK